MRCTRCDGIAVPQAVGIAPDGKVVFGYCRSCLEDTDCRLVEVPARGPYDLRLRFSSVEKPRSWVSAAWGSASSADGTQGLVGIVAFLLVSWGLAVLTVGLVLTSQPSPGASPFGNGTPSLLGVGGGFTALLGLTFLVLAASRQSIPGPRLLMLLTWLPFGFAVIMLLFAIVDYQPRRNVPLVLGVSVALLISIVSGLLDRSRRRNERAVSPWPFVKKAPTPGRTSADGPGRVL